MMVPEATIVIDSDSDDNDDVQIIETTNPLIAQDSRNDSDGGAFFYAKRSESDNVIGPWQSCDLESEELNVKFHKDRTYIVQFHNDKQKKCVASYELARNVIPNHDDLSLGTRIIARRLNDNLPYTLDENRKKVMLYANGEHEFYPGILVRFDRDRYLVFFDDGIIQYVLKECMRRVEGNDRYNHAHWKAKRYFEFISNHGQYKFVATVNEKMKVELNGQWKKAMIMKIDGSLILIHFKSDKRFEWIYWSSPRIFDIYRQIIVTKNGGLFDSLTDLKTYKACLDPNNHIPIVEKIDPREELKHKSERKDSCDDLPHIFTSMNNIQPAEHECGPECLFLNDQKGESNTDIERYGALLRPLITGWARFGKLRKFYRSPCGVTFRSYRELEDYLMRTNSKLRMNCFDFSKNVNIPNVFPDILMENDISRGKEKIPIEVKEPISLDFEYITGQNFDYIAIEPENNLARTGCNCKDNCRDKTKCSCWRLTVQQLKKRPLDSNQYSQNKKIGYTYMKLLDYVQTGIVECGSQCKCCSDKCANRVVQYGQQHKLEVFKTDHKGWGVKTKTDLPEGAFISHYAGDVLERSTADKLDYTYQFRLPKNTANTEEDLEKSFESDFDSDDEQTNKMARNELFDVQQPFLNYLPMFKYGNAEYFPESDSIRSNEQIIIDARKHGNVSRFFNHSCDPNMFTQMVYVNDDKRFPMIAFFTSRIVKAEEELTFDYSYEQSDDRETACHCDAKNCRQRLM